MKIIKCLSAYIEEEIQDAGKYARKALEIKSEHPVLAETLFQLSQEEMGHMQKLHAEVTRLITQYQNEHGDPPVEMQAVYNYLHEKQIDAAKEVKILQSMYRE